MPIGSSFLLGSSYPSGKQVPLAVTFPIVFKVFKDMYS